MNRLVMSMIRVCAVFALVGLIAKPASAASIIYTADSNVISGNPLGDLTHQSAYTWQLNGINLSGYTVTSARLTFFNFANWTSATADPYNVLFVDLLNTSTHAGNNQVASMTDNSNGSTLGLADISDAFREPSGGNNISVVGASGLVSSSSLVTYVGSSYNQNLSAQSATVRNNAGYDITMLGDNPGAFGTTAVTWHLDFGATALAALVSYINAGNNIALGLDADCHFADSDIRLDIYGTQNVTQSGVPEPGTLALLGSGLVAVIRRRRAARRA